MAAPSVLILYSRDAYEEKQIAEKIQSLLQVKYKEYTIMRYWSPFELADKGKRKEALAQARHFILLLSPSFITAYAQNPEWSHILTKDLDGERGIILPIYIEQCDCRHILEPKAPINFIGFSTNDTSNGQISQRLYHAFDLAQEKWKKHNNSSSVLKSGRTTTLSFPTPFPDISYSYGPSRNSFFIGQEEILKKIEDTFLGAQAAQPNAPYKLVLSGLRGSGKTQIALAYAHIFFDLGTYQYLLWVEGGVGSTGSKQALDEKLKPLIQDMSEKGMFNGTVTDVKALKDWLAKHRGWLLIFDEVDDVSLIDDYIPSIGQGHVLVTTCTKIVGQIDLHAIEKMNDETAIFFLLKRARLGNYQTFDEIPALEKQYAKEIVRAMHLFPLAIDHVGAYIDSSSSSLEEFVTNYLKDKVMPLIDLLRDRESRHDRYHPLTLVESWQAQFQLMKTIYPMAADLLIFCAFFRPEGVYPKIITEGRSFLGSHLALMTDLLSSPSSLEGLFKQLRTYSFIDRTPWPNRMLFVHPFLPIILLDLLSQDEQLDWAKRSIQAVAHTLRSYGTVMPGQQEQVHWQEQFKACERLIAQWGLQSSLPDDVRIILEYKDKWLPQKEGEK